MAAGSKEMWNPAACLTDDLIVEILSRMPVKSVCRFKCVSKHWRRLISHPYHRKKLPQTLAGFFYHTTSRERSETARHFTNVTGWGAPLIRPSLSFLPGHADITLLDSCNGLLLCRSPTATGANRYVVCNPATEEWVALPESSQAGNIWVARLGFDPAVSPNFHVFEVLLDGHFVEGFEIYSSKSGDGHFVEGFEIYSSESGQWAHRNSAWDLIVWDDVEDDVSTVFLNGFLHVLSLGHEDVLVIGTEGNSQRTIPGPQVHDPGFIGHSQGRLYYLCMVDEHVLRLSVYVLEDYESDEWIFKHSVRTSLLSSISFCVLKICDLITIHPECHLIFYVSDLDNTVRCYDMDSRKVHVIRNMGCELDFGCSSKRWLSYVPLFAESLAAWN